MTLPMGGTGMEPLSRAWMSRQRTSSSGPLLPRWHSWANMPSLRWSRGGCWGGGGVSVSGSLPNRSWAGVGRCGTALHLPPWVCMSHAWWLWPCAESSKRPLPTTLSPLLCPFWTSQGLSLLGSLLGRGSLFSWREFLSCTRPSQVPPGASLRTIYSWFLRGLASPNLHALPEALKDNSWTRRRG